MKATNDARFPERLLDRLLLGDCVQRMREFPSGVFDLIVTDPPYVTRYEDRSGRKIDNDDNGAWLVPAFREAFRVLRPNRLMVCFYGWPKAELFLEAWRVSGFRPVGHFVAPKRYTSRQRFVKYQHEMAYLLAKGNPPIPQEPIPDILPWKYTGNRWHPTEKPVSTLIPLIRAFTAPGERVLDPFAGSATTLIAAAHEQRRYCGIELDRRYYALARRRLEVLHVQHGAAA
jgi:adenine-specific DNA-methyltransferase